MSPLLHYVLPYGGLGLVIAAMAGLLWRQHKIDGARHVKGSCENCGKVRPLDSPMRRLCAECSQCSEAW